MHLIEQNFGVFIYLGRHIHSETLKSWSHQGLSLKTAYNLVHIVSGPVIINQDLRQWNCTEGSYWLLQPGMEITISNHARVRQICFDIHPRPRKHVKDQIYTIIKTTSAQERFEAFFGLSYDPQLPMQLYSSTMQLMQFVLDHYWIDELSHIEANLRLQQWLLSYLRFRITTTPVLQNTSDGVTDTVRKMLRLNTSLRVSELSKTLGISRATLLRRYKVNTGHTLREDMLSSRMDRAKYLLKTSNLTLKQIALECGYASLSTFCNVFRKFTGFSPKAWSRSNSI